MLIVNRFVADNAEPKTTCSVAPEGAVQLTQPANEKLPDGSRNDAPIATLPSPANAEHLLGCPAIGGPVCCNATAEMGYAIVPVALQCLGVGGFPRRCVEGCKMASW